MPTVSDKGKLVTVHLRSGVRFSPPVNRDVTSADVKYAIERGFDASVANGYVGAYFGDLVGAPAKVTKSVPNITGIETPNSSTVVFKLKQPEGAFIGALGLPVTAPVPASYARPFDSRTVSTYGLHQVATGPYMYLGKIVELAPSDELYARPVHPYTEALLAAVPVVSSRARDRKGRREVLGGDVPSPISPPAACRFHPRCPYATEVCAEIEPPLVAHGPGRVAACHHPLGGGPGKR